MLSINELLEKRNATNLLFNFPIKGVNSACADKNDCDDNPNRHCFCNPSDRCDCFCKSRECNS